MSEYAEKFGVVKPADKIERGALRSRPPIRPVQHKPIGVKLGRMLTAALKVAVKDKTRG